MTEEQYGDTDSSCCPDDSIYDDSNIPLDNLIECKKSFLDKLLMRDQHLWVYSKEKKYSDSFVESGFEIPKSKKCSKCGLELFAFFRTFGQGDAFFQGYCKKDETIPYYDAFGGIHD